MIVSRGQIFFEKEHMESVKQLPKYARERYFAIARTLANKPFGITRKEVCQVYFIDPEDQRTLRTRLVMKRRRSYNR